MKNINQQLTILLKKEKLIKNDCIIIKKYLKNIKKKLNRFNNKYKKSYNKDFYIKFDNLHDLLSYRDNLNLKIIKLNNNYNIHYKLLNILFNQYIVIINCILYYQLLLNK